MSKIFKQNQQYSPKIGRNNFDLSFDNNFTTKFGQITPIFVKEVNPGESFRINANIGLRALPLAFPIQTPVKVQVSFFYVPNRILWEQWMDFYGQTKPGLQIPWISLPASESEKIGTCTLADYLGVPTTYASDSGTDFVAFRPSYSSTINSLSEGESTFKYDDSPNPRLSGSSYSSGSSSRPIYDLNLMSISAGSLVSSCIDSSGLNTFHTGLIQPFTFNNKFRLYCSSDPNIPSFNLILSPSIDIDSSGSYLSSHFANPSYFLIPMTWHPEGYYEGSMNGTQFDIFSTHVTRPFFLTLADETNTLDINAFVNYISLGRKFVSVTDPSGLYNPFCVQVGDTEPDIKLCALPFRAYQCIFNSYYRNSNGVDPFILNNVPEYNRYCTNLSGGADTTTPLNLEYRNYELDFLTSCYKSPQLGDAALVGVSSTGKFTFEDENGAQFVVTPIIGDDGDVLTGIDSYSEGTPIGSLTRLRDLISYGISISDFRQVNSYQKFLERSLRRGLRYADVVKSHTNVNVRYKAVDLPEYIGGFTRTLNVRQISSTAETSEMQLGEYRGQAGLFDGSRHSINHYCDENGYIMGLLTIVPIPCYSQLLPHYFIKDNLLSWHFPEFNNIQMQPIDYRSVTPIQAKLHALDYSTTFGYQRPFSELIASYDEVHGKFRTDLNGYLITRLFGEPPQLNANFLKINPSEMTNPFVDASDDSHTFMGQVHFDVKAKRPISRIHIPSL